MTSATNMEADQEVLVELRDRWDGHWENAIDAWSSFTQLSKPRWCLTPADEQREGLTGSFAMIRLADHAVVISLRQVAEKGIDDFAVEVLAHEIGHHVYAPGDLNDNARLLAHIRAGLPGLESMAPMVANLYTDLLINDRLQRRAELDMAGVYRTLRQKNGSDLWSFYMHTYELLWGLSQRSLFDGPLTDKIRADAILTSRLIRNYSGDWLDGAGRFAAICFDYLQDEKESVKIVLLPWLDTEKAGAGETVPDGLTRIGDQEVDGAIHPALDGARELEGGTKNPYREPREYVELMKSLHVDIPEKKLVVRYYRELAMPHIAPYPVRASKPTTEPLIEGVERWEPGAPLSTIDWMETALRSPVIVPGVTTMKRVTGESQGDDQKSAPADLYLGVDCSGSMNNPAINISYPVVAGTVITLSALRAGAKVKTILSGEPGEYQAMDEYRRDEGENLATLTGYLGTGYAFGLQHLDLEFPEGVCRDKPVHILIITDADIFAMLDRYPDGWEVARRAAEQAGGGATFVLEIRYRSDMFDEKMERLESLGWQVFKVSDHEELVDFSREFSRRKFGGSSESPDRAGRS